MKRAFALLLSAVFLAGMLSGCAADNKALSGTVAEIDESGNVYIGGISPKNVADAGKKASDIKRMPGAVL